MARSASAKPGNGPEAFLILPICRSIQRNWRFQSPPTSPCLITASTESRAADRIINILW